MYIEVTLPTGGRIFLKKDAIVSVTVGKNLKDESPVITTVSGQTYTVTVETEKNTLARLIGMRS